MLSLLLTLNTCVTLFYCLQNYLKRAFVCYLGHSEATDLYRPCQTSIQLAFACSKSTVEALEKDVKYVQS